MLFALWLSFIREIQSGFRLGYYKHWCFIILLLSISSSFSFWVVCVCVFGCFFFTGRFCRAALWIFFPSRGNSQGIHHIILLRFAIGIYSWKSYAEWIFRWNFAWRVNMSTIIWFSMISFGSFDSEFQNWPFFFLSLSPLAERARVCSGVDCLCIQRSKKPV